MPPELTAIKSAGVNCYLIRAGDGFILTDTGVPYRRSNIERELVRAGCIPGKLRLIILTHDDYDHAGNAAYLQGKYGARIAVSGAGGESPKARPDRFSTFFRIVSFFIRAGKTDAFKPDVYLNDGQSLAEYGSDAFILHLPGHTPGSIGVLLKDGRLLCGDLLANFRKPGLHFFINDLAAARKSIEKLKNAGVKSVYPGHGKPFFWEDFLKRYR